MIETSRGPLEYGDAGSGSPILYFHGSGAANDLVLSIERPLLFDGYRLIVPNRPGYGRTPLSCGKSSSDCADLAAELLDRLAVTAVAVMGSSGGGLFAARFAERHPRTTACLILECAQTHRWDGPDWLPEQSRWTYPYMVRPFWRHLLLAMYRFQLRWSRPLQLLKMEAGRRFGEFRSDPKAIEFCRVTLASMKECQTSPAGFYNDFAILMEEELLKPDSVHCPTLVIYDPCDPLAPTRHHEWTRECIHHAEMCNVHGAGHLIWLGPDADAMHRRRVEFLRRHLRCFFED